jgi:DNA-binding transcriptional ArsR family regulator
MRKQSDRLTRTFAALADPTRRAILSRLASGEASVTEIAKPLRISMPAVTKHLKVLESAGLIRRGKQAQWRPCYLVAEPLKEAANWVEQYRQFWEARFDRLDDYLRQMQAEAEAIRMQKPESEPPARPLKKRRKP